jgi:hypothetical protein
MSALADKLAEAVLYEGYVLYPYRHSPGGNRERFTFGRVYPRAYSEAQGGAEPCQMQTECIARRDAPDASLAGRVRFLQPMDREIYTASPSGAPVEPVAELRVDGNLYQTWHEAVERDIALPEIPLDAMANRPVEFYFPESQTDEILRDSDGAVAGVVRRRQHAVAGEIDIAIEPLDATLVKVSVCITNRTPLSAAETRDLDSIILSTLAATHTILRVRGAQFDSLTDPPAADALAILACENIGTWPVLVGDESRHERHTMLSSPIILYDYPRIAPGAAGELCEGLDIDPTLLRRTPRMSDDDDGDTGAPGDFGSRILGPSRERDFMESRGSLDDIHFPSGDCFRDDLGIGSAEIGGLWHHPGDRVRIKPRGRADAPDKALAGKVAIIEAIEQDSEDRVRLALVLEDDPERDVGMFRQPGHRFFCGLDEVEAVDDAE